jgi:hypothetical protein
VKEKEREKGQRQKNSQKTNFARSKQQAQHHTFSPLLSTFHNKQIVVVDD